MKGLFTGLGVSLKTLVSKKVTRPYPDEPWVQPDRYRGIQYLDVDACIVCFQCQRICPTSCITLVGKANPDPEKKGKVLDTFDINFEHCILCDLCTEVCPTDAIQMTNNFELATYSRDELLKDIDYLSTNTKNIRQENKPGGGSQVARRAKT
jgi:NADH-quinone oxidoreductase subunit I